MKLSVTKILVLVFCPLIHSLCLAQHSLSILDFSVDSEKAICEPVSEESRTGTFFYELKIAHTENRTPKLYCTELLTSVCETGQCYLVKVNIFWDLTGSYMGFSLPTGEMLTKLDHKPFTDADYHKLDRILKDQHWPLARYPISELVSESDHDAATIDRKTTTAPVNGVLDLGNNTLFDKEVDAYSGATAPFVTEEDNISGALYTIYTLWDFIDDPNIIASLQKYTSSLIETDSLQSTDLLKQQRSQRTGSGLFSDWITLLLIRKSIVY